MTTRLRNTKPPLPVVKSGYVLALAALIASAASVYWFTHSLDPLIAVLFILPFPFGVGAVVCAIVNLRRKHVVAGIAQIGLAIICSAAGFVTFMVLLIFGGRFLS